MEIRPELIQLIKKLDEEGKLLSAICAGPRFLAKAGILDKVKYTTSIKKWTQLQKDNFKEDDPFPRENFIEERVVRDQNVITATGIAFIDFAVEICDWFNLFNNEQDKIDFMNNMKGI